MLNFELKIICKIIITNFNVTKLTKIQRCDIMLTLIKKGVTKNMARKSQILEKIEALTEWIEKYPKATIVPKVSEDVLRQYSKTEEEYKQILEEYEKMKRYYDYVKDRSRKNKLKSDEYSKCKEGNIGGVFGYPTKIEELAKQYGISEEKIRYIMTNYGTMDNFYKLFRKQEIKKEKDIILANSFIKNLVDVDGNSNVGYDKLFKEITHRRENSCNELVLYSSEKIDECLKKIGEREGTVLIRRFFLPSNNKSRTLRSIAREMEVTVERIRQIEQRGLRRLKFRRKEFSYDLNKLKNSDLATDDEKMKLLELENELNDINFSRVDIQSKSVLEGLELLKVIQKRIEERGTIPKYITIQKAGLSTRACKALRFHGINYLQEVSNYTYEQIKKFRNIGTTTMQEIVAKLEEHGLQLKEEPNVENEEAKEKQELVERILKQQEKIAEQQDQIKDLSYQKKEL